jgi:hypothetical protein
MKITMGAGHQRHDEPEREDNTAQSNHGLSRKAGSGPACTSCNTDFQPPIDLRKSLRNKAGISMDWIESLDLGTTLFLFLR